MANPTKNCRGACALQQLRPPLKINNTFKTKIKSYKNKRKLGIAKPNRNFGKAFRRETKGLNDAVWLGPRQDERKHSRDGSRVLRANSRNSQG
jgi:hypothetical protein